MSMDMSMYPSMPHVEVEEAHGYTHVYPSVHTHGYTHSSHWVYALHVCTQVKVQRCFVCMSAHMSTHMSTHMSAYTACMSADMSIHMPKTKGYTFVKA